VNKNDDFSNIVNIHLKPVYNFIYRLVGSAKDAEDIAQETFFKAWKSIKTYRPDENFKTWIFTIARNTAIDFMRKKKNLVFSDFENAEGENVLLDTVADPKHSAEKITAKIENKKLAEKILNKLSPIYREILLLKYVQDLTFDEIGKVLKKPLHTVKSQHRRAMLFIKKTFDAPK